MPDPLRVFVASSSEQVGTAYEVAHALTEAGRLEAYPWDEKTFDFSDTYIESLEGELTRADFAVVVLTADDPALVRKKAVNLPRDNVIFELGLFIGRLGRKRCFFLVDGDSATKIASDLSGVKPVKFCRQAGAGGTSTTSLAEQAVKVRNQMMKQGPRHKPLEASRATQEAIWRFSSNIAGHWWERMRSGEDDKSALSYVTVMVDDVTGGPRMEADSYGLNGELLAGWHTVTSGVTLGDRPRIVYYWEGAHDNAQGQTYGGAASTVFDDGTTLQTAKGYYYDTNLALIADGATTRVKHFRLYRCDPADTEIMRRPGSEDAARLVRERVRSLSSL